MKLRLKILAMCLGCTLFALILQTLLFQRTSSEVIYNWSKEESVNSLQNMQNEIYAFLKKMESNLIEVYNEQELIEALKEGQTIGGLRAGFYRKAYEIGTTDFDTSDGVVSLYLYTPNHEIISTYRRAMTPKHNYPSDLYEEADACNAGKIQEFVESGRTGMLVSSYYNEYRETDILHLVLKLFDNRNYNKVIGYVVCDVDSKAVRSIMEKYSTDRTMYIWLQPVNDRAALSIGVLNPDEEEIYREITGQIQSGNEDGEDARGTENQEFFEVSQNKYNLTAYSLMPQELLQENQKVLTANVILIGGIMVGAAAVLTFILSRNLTRPLDELMRTMEKIKNGDTSVRVKIQDRKARRGDFRISRHLRDSISGEPASRGPMSENLLSEDLPSRNLPSLGGPDEIGMLGQNFNEMLDRIEELAEKEKKTTYLLGQAKYNALQAQINPHFLYNTLETMSSIAQIRECPEVSRLSMSLSNIFRYSLNMKDHFSTVSKEITHLKNYCYVMEVRMQDGVRYIYEVEEEALSKEIPRLSLQPLVENALNHGLRNKRGGKEVRILARHEGELLRLCIADNGVGMDARGMNEKLRENDIQYVEQGKSIGLYNINARLKMLYGMNFGLRIESAPDQGTKVYMEIPWEKKNGKETV